MGLLGAIVAKGVVTAARNATIKTVGNVAVDVIAAKKQSNEGIVEKKGILYTRPTRTSQAYCERNAYEVANELLGAGFERVTLRPVKKLGEFSVKKYGRVNSVSINGTTSFSNNKKFPLSAYIIVEYLDFRESIRDDIYSKVIPITPGELTSSSSAKEEKICDVAPSKVKMFCAYCGKRVEDEKARFCCFCGKEI